MKNYYKRILIMFVMALTIMSIGIIKNEVVANAATIGEQLLEPEDGWKRYDDTDGHITYNDFVHEDNNGGNLELINNVSYYKKTRSCQINNNSSIKFYFYGDKFKIISDKYHPYRINKINVIIDGTEKIVDLVDNDIQRLEARVLQYESEELKLGNHSVTIKGEFDENKEFILDAIDIKYGYLIDPAIKLEKQSLTLKENNTKKLTAITTPSAVDVEWSSSDDTIAVVDENGKLTGVKEGTCIITAQIKGTDVKANCEVTVTKEDIVEPEEPSIENGSLYIEMVDGNIKRADKGQIEKFKKWFISRDLDETESPIFKITNAKGNAEYLVHDKVVGFEIRE